MTGNLVIWLDDEYALGARALHDTRNPAVAWLDAQFTYRWATLAYLDDNDPVPGPDCIRPMAELIDPARRRSRRPGRFDGHPPIGL